MSRLPVGVLVIRGFALEVQRGSTLGVETSTLLEAIPLLLNVQLPADPVKSKSCHITAVAAGCLAGIGLGPVEEVLELARGGGADGLVVEGGVGEGEVDVAVGVLVGWGGEDVGGVEVEVVDGPGRVTGALDASFWLGGRRRVGGSGGGGEGRRGEEERCDEGIHLVGLVGSGRAIVRIEDI